MCTYRCVASPMHAHAVAQPTGSPQACAHSCARGRLSSEGPKLNIHSALFKQFDGARIATRITSALAVFVGCPSAGCWRLSPF